MNVIFREKFEQLFKDYWNLYLSEDEVDFSYSLQVLDFHLECSANLFSDKSFVVEQDGKCVGICFLPIESGDIMSVSVNGGYVVKPLAKTEKVEKYLLKKVEEVCLNKAGKEVNN